MTRMLRRWRLAGVLAAAAVVTACSVPPGTGAATINSVNEGKVSPYHGTLIDPPYHLPSATWTDTNGSKVRWPAGGLPQPVTVVFFGYTSCPDVCSTQLADLTQAIRASDPEVRDKIAVQFVTVDPQRDDAAAIRTYLDGFDKTLQRKFVGLRTEDTSMLLRAAEALGVALTGSNGTASGYEVGHGAQLIGFGRNGAAPVIWLPGTAIGDMRTDLATLARS